MLLAIALALLVAQGLSSGLIWRAQRERHINAMVSGLAFRLLGQAPPEGPPPPDGAPRPEGLPGLDGRGPLDGPPAGPPRARRAGPPTLPGDPEARLRRPPNDLFRLPRSLRLTVEPNFAPAATDRRRSDAESLLHDMLEAQGVTAPQVVVLERRPWADPLIGRWYMRSRRGPLADSGEDPPRLAIAALRQSDGRWLVARVMVPADERRILMSIALQTVFIYIALVGATALILRRIARPLKALTRRVESFAADRSIDGQLAPEGPEDVQRLIDAHNAMEHRIVSLLDEKDVMLGAIGHDLKTPLAALRVRIEAVDDDAERARMAATIEDITRSLDDILSLARVGRPTDPVESTQLSALVADVVGEYEDMGEDVELGETERMVLRLRPTWVRRGLRNLVSNALRYGTRARVSLARDGRHAVLRIEDDGPGIPDPDIARMMEPFTRLEASRNSATGGAGLGLALARAIAEQHGGSLMLINRPEGGQVGSGRIAGLTAELRLPLS
ncbi:sensor histidine kinase [Novosphingobium olei]|uniref:sensor histidine kinase n=1 Tax=Novosphingobium olei TaxID=2728851 RepID=UPI0030CC6761